MDWKGRNRTVFIDDMIIYLENLKELTKKSSGTNKPFQQDCRIKGYSQKTTAFPNTNNEQLEFGIKNSIIYIGTPENEMFKYKSDEISIYLYIYEENYKILIRNIKEDLNKLRAG